MQGSSIAGVHGYLSVCPLPNINDVEEKATKSERMFGPVVDNLSEPAEQLTGMENKERNEILMPAFKKSSDSIQRYKKKAKRGRPKVLKQEKFIEKPSEPANMSLDSLERKLLDLGDEIRPVLADEKPSEMSDKEPNEPAADMAPGQLLIEYPATRWENAWSLEQEDGKLPDGELLGKNKIEGPEQKLPQPEDAKSSTLEKKQPNPDGGGRAIIINGGSSNSKTKKAAMQPLRASKRLAGLEAGPPADDWRIGYRFRWAMSKRRFVQTEDVVVLEEQETEVQDGEAALREQAESGKPTTDDNKLESPLTLPFGDSWPDPCLQFAFKTLTGDIPVSEESLRIQQNILDHQLSSVQKSDPSVVASSTFAGGPESSSTAELPAKPASLDKNFSSSREEGRPSFTTKNGLQSGGKVIQQYRRATKLHQ